MIRKFQRSTRGAAHATTGSVRRRLLARCLLALAVLWIVGNSIGFAIAAAPASSPTKPSPAPSAEGGRRLPAPADVAAPPASATKTSSGLAHKVLKSGSGKTHPGKNDWVTVDYTGWTTDGKMFDSTVTPLAAGRSPAPATFSLSAVIDGFAEGVALMVVGESRRLWIPESLAYQGEKGAPVGMLVFDIELLDFTPGLTTPDDCASAPADAIRERSGLASKVIEKGAGKVHPKANDDVKIDYALWTPSGKLLDSNAPTPKGNPRTPIQRPVTWVIDGWAQAIELMVVGEKRVFWIPADLAFKGKPGAPQGDIVLEVALTEIVLGPETPKELSPPKDAVREASGLATKVLKKGGGTAHPGPASEVTVAYAGWTTDGKMFDASMHKKSGTATVHLSTVIPGWSEGIQLMVEGESRRFWVPEELAYKGRSGSPSGMLVFDVQLVRIEPPTPLP